MLYGLSLVTAATTEPVTLAEVKKQVEMSTSYTAHDDHLMRLASSARQYVEAATNRAIVTQTWDMFLDRWPECNSAIYAPKPPLQSVTHIKYYDQDGVQQTWSSANYIVSTSREPGRIAPGFQVLYPAFRYQADSINVRFVCGYGAQSAIPEKLKAAILLLTAHWFEHREEVMVGSAISEVPFAAQCLIEQSTVGDEFVNYSGVSHAGWTI